MSCAPTLIILIALSQNPGAPVSDVSELSRLESEWNQAHVCGDAKVLDGLWADDLVVTVPKMPRFNRSQSLQIWRSGRITHVHGYAATQALFWVTEPHHDRDQACRLVGH
jgi:hypothetical protein